MTRAEDAAAELVELGETTWNPEMELGANTSQTKKSYKIAFIESANKASYFELALEFRRQQVMLPQQTPQGVVQVPGESVVWRMVERGWR